MAANADRAVLSIYNNGPNTVYYGYIVGTTVANGHPLPANSGVAFEPSDGLARFAYWVICDTGETANLAVTQGLV